LTAATGTKQVVVLLVTRRGSVAFEHGHGGAFDSDYDGRVAGIAEHVTSNPAVLPSKRYGVVPALTNIDPFGIVSTGFVGVFGHVCEIEDCPFVGNVGT
jgi:hypothetical protein